MKGEDQQIFTDSHAKSILTTMNSLRKMDKLCDVSLKVQDRVFPAHRIVLAACSDYFFAMFTGNVGIQLINPKGAQWLSGRVLDSRPRGRGFEPHWCHCVESLSKTHLSLRSTGSTQEDPSRHN